MPLTEMEREKISSSVNKPEMRREKATERKMLI